MAWSIPYLCDLYKKFKHESLCMDIESAGRGEGISVIGLYKPQDGLIEATSLIKEQDLTSENLKAIFSNCKMLITYNGLEWDIPVIKRYFPGVIPSGLPVMDLYLFAKKLVGEYTNLKVLENTLGIDRIDSKTKRRGIAVRLWKKYVEYGDEKALSTLIEYNKQDTINLYPIAEELVKAAIKQKGN